MDNRDKPSKIEKIVHSSLGFAIPAVAYSVGDLTTKSQVGAALIMSVSSYGFALFDNGNPSSSYRKLGYITGTLIGMAAGIGGCISTDMN